MIKKLIAWFKRNKIDKPKPGTIHTVGNRRYYIHENGQFERLED